MPGIPIFVVSVFPLGVPYAPSDQIQYSETITYFGFLADNGRWYIQEQTVSGNNITWKYCKGNDGYAAAIADPHSLTYKYFDEVF